MSLVLQLFQIVILKREPKDLSYDPIAAALAFGGLIAISYFINQQITQYTHPLGYAVVHTSAQGAAVYGILSMRFKTERFVQTITALFGTTVILQMMSLIALVSNILAVLSVFASVWNFYLIIVILRTALDSSLLKTVGYTVLYLFVASFVTILIYPDFPAEMLAALNPQGTS